MEYPRCSVCGRPLKNKESIEKGIGPKCARKLKEEVSKDAEG